MVVYLSYYIVTLASGVNRVSCLYRFMGRDKHFDKFIVCIKDSIFCEFLNIVYRN